MSSAAASVPLDGTYREAAARLFTSDAEPARAAKACARARFILNPVNLADPPFWGGGSPFLGRRKRQAANTVRF